MSKGYRSKKFRDFIIKKLENHGIMTYNKFISRCMVFLNNPNFIKNKAYHKAMHLGQAYRGNISFGPKALLFIIEGFLHDKIDDHEICQLLMIGSGQDLRNKRYGSLVVKECLGVNDDEYRLLWKCLCDCGKEHIVEARYLNQKVTVSCGCYRREASRERIVRFNLKHGFAKSPEYRTYINLKSSCYNENHPRYKNYGALGVKLCDRWKESFMNFYEDVGPRPGKAVFRRIDSTKDFTPDNCHWIER